MATNEQKKHLREEIERFRQGSRREDLLEAAAALVGVVPGLGSTIAAYFAGTANEYKAKRLEELFEAMADDLDGLSDKVSTDYLKTEDFADLLDETLRRVANERSQEKRRIYKNILVDAIAHPSSYTYDEQLRFLRTLENLQPAHIAVLKAIMVRPTDEQQLRMSGYAGSQIQTLEQRLPKMSARLIDELVAQLNDERLTDFGHLHTMTSPSGAQDLSTRLTPYGQRFVAFLRE